MALEKETTALVVGAGPVGMGVALRLADAGFEVAIVDQADGVATDDIPCVLHPDTLKHLEAVGLTDAVRENGRRVDRLALYHRDRRMRELDFSILGDEHAYVITLAEGRWEQLLEEYLKKRADLAVQWAHRFSRLQQNGSGVTVELDELERTSKGYVVSQWEWSVRKTLEVRAEFVVGADGPASPLRQALQIHTDSISPGRRVAIFVFRPQRKAPEEIRLVLDSNQTSVYWPLPDDRACWMFELEEVASSAEVPPKGREGLDVEHRREDRQWKKILQQLVDARAPWFEAGIETLDWADEIDFPNRQAQMYGSGACWLAGGAAHQTGPLASHDLNAGWREIEALTGDIVRVFHEKAPRQMLDHYGERQRDHWTRLINPSVLPGPEADTAVWPSPIARRLPACLPAAGKQLDRLLRELGLKLG